MDYIFFHTVTGNEKLLLHWLKKAKPDWRLSFSAPGWVTVKTSKLEDISNLECPLALRWGRGLKVLTKELSAEICLELLTQNKAASLHYWERAEIKGLNKMELQFSTEISFNKKLEPGQLSLQIMKINHALYGIGLTNYLPPQSPLVGSSNIFNLPEGCPSRAYLKLAHLDEFYCFPWKVGDLVLEVGSAPGGISSYLIEKKLEVFAVDSAEMKLAHPKLHTLKQSVQQLQPQDIPNDVCWVVSDLNLSPNQTLNEVVRLSGHLNLKGLIVTIKLPQLEMVWRLNEYVEKIKKNFPGLEVSLRQVCSHKQETHLVAFKK